MTLDNDLEARGGETGGTSSSHSRWRDRDGRGNAEEGRCHTGEGARHNSRRVDDGDAQKKSVLSGIVAG